MGDEPATITHYVYDGDRLVRSEARQEAEWNERSRAVLCAYLDYESDLHTCGRPLSESLLDVSKQQEPYVVVERTCRGCQKLQDHVEAEHKKGMPAHVLPQVLTRSEAVAMAKQVMNRKG